MDSFFVLSQSYNLSACPSVLLAKICSYLGSNETLVKIPLMTKGLNYTVKYDSQFLKALNSDHYENFQMLQ